MIIPVAPINRLPQGLLGFLGIKNGGKNPTVLSDLLSPTWNLEKLYTQGNAETAEALPNVTALGYVAAFTVPVGQYWFVHEIGTYSAVLTAGQSVLFNLAIRGPDGSIATPITDTAGGNVVGNRYALGTECGCLYMPNQSFGLYVTNLAAGPIGFSVSMRFTRMT